MDKSKKIGIIIGIVIYLFLSILFIVKLPTIMSLGNPDVQSVMSSGQTAAIYQKDIDISSFSGKIKSGDTIYVTAGVENRYIISKKKSTNAIKSVVVDVNESKQMARINMHVNNKKAKGTPGLIGFQLMIALLLIFVPIFLLSKNDMIDLGFLSGINVPKFSRSKTKYGNQGTATTAGISELRDLAGNDGYTISKRFRLSASKSYEHALVLGPTGSGKSSAFFIPNMLDMDGSHSLVVTDPKTEMYNLTKDYLTSIGYNVIKIQPLNADGSDYYYNPILITENDQEIHELAQIILTNGGKSVEMSTGGTSNNAEWINMSVPLFAAALGYVKLFGKRKSIPEAIDIILKDNLEELENKFSKDKFTMRQFLVFKSSAGSEKTLSSIKSVLTTNVQLFLEEKIEKFVTLPPKYNEEGKKVPDMSKMFKPKELRERPTALFVCVPEDKSTYMMPLMSAFYTQLFNMTTSHPDGQPILFYLDEFANIGVIPVITSVVTTARSRRIGISLGLQGVEQLDRNYGKENATTILNNLKTKLVFSGLTGDSAKYVSDLSGFTTIETKSYSSGGQVYQDTLTNILAGQQISKSGTRRELITPDEVRRMDEDTVLIIAHNKNPVYDKKNTYFTQERYKKKLSK